MRRTALLAVVLAFVVVVMGAWVRLNTAGLGCPDWPGCYGHVTPLGAVIATIALLLSALWVLRERGLALARWAALAVLVTLGLQLLIGVTMVEEGFPLWLATAHNGGAALLLLAVLTLNFRLRCVAGRT